MSLFLFCVFECLPVCISMHHVHTVPFGPKRRSSVPWNWICELSVWVLGTELSSSARATNAHSCQDIAPAPASHLTMLDLPMRFNISDKHRQYLLLFLSRINALTLLFLRYSLGESVTAI